ncbi:class I adenylate-forming enzyme family protein [Dermatobacter hominis]|uniref:class I adenylate-forming enzyme family protein n=1 Tax=Dermatobacter hominis TaxID=2884263 RepID=UPI001D124A31|nr:AMP-binding protein [Dermatobacter hominis]UDY36627.1 AMP-binding protein [Dermatobacter hominis]
MHLDLILSMAADVHGDRIAVGPMSDGLTVQDLATRARRVGAALAERPIEHVGLIDLNSSAVPLTLFGAAVAGRPFVPINYRLTDDQLRRLVERIAPAVVVVGDGVAERLGDVDGVELLTRQELLDLSADESIAAVDAIPDPDAVAVLLYTSGTTGEPKAAVLRHLHLGSYIVTTVELGGAEPDEAALVSVPPYHIAGISASLSSLYGGRRVVYLESFDPAEWVRTAREEGITHAMVVPTMLNRILDVVAADGGGLPALRTLSYGGGPMPLPVIERAMALLPDTGFVNAYGLTETSSTIALLGPDDHREAMSSDDPAVRARLGSVGRPLPTLEVTVRDELGREVPPGTVGELWVRGEQVSGEYRGAAGGDDEGWFRTRDSVHLDDEGYLFVHGRLDDVIVRGGENLSPGEIEAVLLDHEAVEEAAVVGIPDTEWGERVVAAVVTVPGRHVDEAELQDLVRGRLRSTRTPERIAVLEELPYNETGKLLRRALREELAAEFA